MHKLSLIMNEEEEDDEKEEDKTQTTPSLIRFTYA